MKRFNISVDELPCPMIVADDEFEAVRIALEQVVITATEITDEVSK